jgi:4-amino-4-deoxy-L-arabinose transferase-like glycosyltransferase
MFGKNFKNCKPISPLNLRDCWKLLMKRKENKKSGSVFLYFYVFLIVDFILSYSAFPLVVKLCFFIAGLAVPLAWAVKNISSAKIDFQEEPFLTPPKWIWGASMLLMIFLRVFDLLFFPVWPTGDEALEGFLGIDLAQNWKWQFFYTLGQHPPLSIWLYSFLCKYLSSPSVLLWVPPALFSFLTVGMGYWAARQFFPKSFAAIFCLLIAFSYWPVEYGHFYFQGFFIPFLELLAFALLGLWIKNIHSSRSQIYLVLLGACTGAGLFTYTSWMVVLGVLVVCVMGVLWKRRDLLSKSFWGYSLALLVTSAPFLIAAHLEHFGAHWADVVGLNEQFSVRHKVLTFLSYWTSLFWGTIEDGIPNRLDFGGFLNPVLASFFWVGILTLIRFKNRILVWAITAGFLSFLLPGILSSDYPCLYRIIQLMPVVLLIVGIGLYALLNQISSRNHKIIFLVVVFFVSFGLDFYHLMQPHLKDGRSFSSGFKKEIPDETYRAYEIFKEYGLKQGPGLIFSDFLLLSHGHQLTVMTYGFNAALNPGIDISAVRWAGIVTNYHYQPFLAGLFPGSQWSWVGYDQSEDDGGLTVGIIPINASNKSLLDRWVKAHSCFHRLSEEAENILNDPKLYKEATQKLPGNDSLMEEDPFLEAIFGEWLAQYHYGPNLQPNIAALQRAIQKGYPSANLYYKLGNFLWLDHRMSEARQAYQAAARCPFNGTGAVEVLKYLDKHGPPGGNS